MSEIVIRDVQQPALVVHLQQAMVSWRGGSVVYRGAISARPSSPSVPQFHFSRVYGARLQGRCQRVPRVALEIATCRATDGSFWSLQRWDRLKPNYGGTSAAAELRISHWREQAHFVDLRWDENYHIPRLCGRVVYINQGVYGFKSKPSGKPLDTYGRNVYLGALDSDYGPGWRRVNSFLTHSPDGSWCYLFASHGSGSGLDAKKYRLTVDGPGVTPVIRTEVIPGR